MPNLSQQPLDLDVVAVDPKQHGAAGDGTTLDDTALAVAASAAAAKGLPLAITRPYLISSTFTPACDLVGTAQGQIKKNATFNGYALNIATDNIALIGPWTVECNRAGGALGGGVDWHNVGGLMRDVIVKSSKGAGVVSESGADLSCHNVESYDHITGGGGDGFVAQSGGRLRTYDCNSHDNDRNGYYFRSGALAGCHLDGRSSQNAIAGAACVGADGTIGVFRSRQDTKYGVSLGFSTVAVTSDWKGGLVVATDTGKGYTRYDGTVIADQAAGTAVETFGATDCSITTIVAHRPLGYGLALAKEATSGTATSKCQFGLVLVDRMGSTNSDPAVSLTGGANLNHVETIIARSTTMALSFGEGVTPATNDNNTFGAVIGYGCTNQLIQNNGGSGNHIARAVSRDCQTSMPTFPAILYFNGVSATVANNTVDYFDHKTLTVAPNALLSQVNGASGNIVNRSAQMGTLGLPAAPTIGSATVITATNAAWPIPSGATQLEITAVGGGGGGSGGGSSSAIANQAGGPGGSAGVPASQVVSVGANTTLNVTIGAGGTGGAGGAASGASGSSGNSGAATTVTGTGISVTGGRGGAGLHPAANSATASLPIAFGAVGSNATQGNVAGCGGSSGLQGGAAIGATSGGGGGGGTTSATNGGSGGGSGGVAGGAAGSTGGSGTAAGGNGTTATGYGGGGGGGGGGAWNGGTSGAGGTGGDGAPGVVIVKVVG